MNNELTKIQNDELRALYLNWIDQIKQKKDSCGIDFFGEEIDIDNHKYPKYSNPHFIEVPYNWNGTSTRIMFVGKELRGAWNKDYSIRYDNIDLLRKLYRSCLYKWVKTFDAQPYDCYDENDNSTPFWNAINRFSSNEVAIIWSNCDKICKPHRNNDGNGSPLNNKERSELHKNTNVLKREIEITKPTHIVFLGWYTESLKPLFGAEVYNLSTQWNARKHKELIFSSKEIELIFKLDSNSGAIPICFAPHPRYYFSTRRTLNEYEQKIRECLELEKH